jgi:hypothetical protein
MYGDKILSGEFALTLTKCGLQVQYYLPLEYG